MGPSVDELLQLEVPVRVVLGQRRMTMHEVRGLLPGSVLELGTMVDEDLEVTVGHRSLATGQACRLGDRAAVQITSVGDPAARISALAKEDDLETDN
ncbi:MAG: FliM/FliN family flagellar motor C-terminal domain-containing protein [Planctomycetota bacterium]|jgi:flagellar motor switch protein FliN/FliY|nr:FliM/FliN family flagellar motor C-terminal domain-containing protein [Planctomycetota bacterium]MEC7196791.1 FliM/FliN family flagellar motor C-terminal domain-containing protein [Planctomycetota bacterium]